MRKKEKKTNASPILWANIGFTFHISNFFSEYFLAIALFNKSAEDCNYSAIINVEYQELINVTLWQKGSKRHSLLEFVCIYLCNLLIINNSLYTLSLNSYSKKESKKRMKTDRKAPETRNFLALKSHFSVAKPQKQPADVPPKVEKRKQKQLASIGEGY